MRQNLPKMKITVWVIILLVTLFTASGCSYFNAFYNTKHYFEQGEKEREKSTDSNARPAGYQKCIESGAKLIEFYPESRYIDDALFYMGQAYYWNQEYHKAKRKFLELTTNYPESPHAEAGKMWLGKSHVAVKERNKATNILRGLISDTKNPEILSGSLFALAELYFVDSLFHKAELEFSDIVTTTEDPEVLGEAYWRAGDAAFRDKNFAKAEEHFTNALKHKLTRSREFQVQFWKGRAQHEEGKFKEAKSSYEKLLKDKRFYEEHPPVRVEYGRNFVSLGDTAEALAQFDKVIETNKRTEHASWAYYEEAVVFLDTPGRRADAIDALTKAQVERAGSRYAKKADTLSTILENQDNLSLRRRKIMKRIEFTELWSANPVSPTDTINFKAEVYYDSLAIDSLKLDKLWKWAWRDSTYNVEPPFDSTAISDSMIVDSLDNTELVVNQDTIQVTELDTVGILIDVIADSLLDITDTLTTVTNNDSVSTLAVTSLDTALIAADTSDSTELPLGVVGMNTVGLAQSTFDTSIVVTDSSQVIADTSMVEAQAPPEPEPITETITIYDPSMVFDTLATMKVQLQDIRFQLAEVLLFDLMEPDSARIIFNELANPPNADSVQARANLALAYIADQDSNIVARDSILTYLADNFAGSKFGEAASIMLGRIVEEKKVVQPDEEAFLEAESFYNVEAADDQEVYMQYRWIADNYPASSFAPKSMFAAAYMAASKLEDFETAEDLFNQLISKYPTSEQAIEAQNIMIALERMRSAELGLDTLDTAMEEDDNVLHEDDVSFAPQIIGGHSSLARILEMRNLLPAEVITGTGGEVLLRYIVGNDGFASDFRVIMEDPPGRGLARAMIQALQEVSFSPGKLEDVAVAVRIERRYTLPLDAPPNIRPLPRRRGS